MRKVVVVGSGPAAIGVVETLRYMHYTGEI
jgi:hypothetical protein